MEESEKKDNGLQIDLLLLDSLSTLETIKETKDKLRNNNNRYSDIDTKLLSLHSKAFYLHILNNLDDIYKIM
jgi:hypothetical protein